MTSPHPGQTGTLFENTRLDVCFFALRKRPPRFFQTLSHVLAFLRLACLAYLIRTAQIRHARHILYTYPYTSVLVCNVITFTMFITHHNVVYYIYVVTH